MGIENIIIGRERAINILNKINPKEAEILYGPRYEGINFCPFIYKKNDIWTGVTVRTTNRPTSIKLNKKIIEYNIVHCQEREYNHELILSFDWSRRCKTFLIPLNDINSSLLDSIINNEIENNYIVIKRKRLEEEIKIGPIELL